jgi:hypothetical protein
MPGYAPQRQMLPLIQRRISSIESACPSAMHAMPATICPDVQ